MDFIKELRTGKPNRDRAARYIRNIGIVCVIISIANITGLFFQKPGRDMAPGYEWAPVFCWGLLTGIGFIITRRGLLRESPWCFTIGRISIGMFIIILCVAYLAMMLHSFSIMDVGNESRGFDSSMIFFAIFGFLILLQAVIPAILGFSYLTRLEKHMRKQTVPETGSAGTPKAPSSVPPIKYRYSPFPLGVFGLFIAVMAFVSIIAHIVEQSNLNLGPFIPILVGAAMIVMIAVPILFERRPTPFEKTRSPVRIFKSRGQLLVYNDGVEIRKGMTAFFIPYEKIEEIELEKEFFSEGISISTDLPDIPPTLNFDCKDKEALYLLVKTKMKERLDTDEKTDRNGIEHVLGEIEKRETRDDNEESKRNSRQVKIAAAIAITQILAFALVGPAVVGYKLLLRDSQNRNVKIMTKAEYASNPVGKDVPSDFTLAKFVFYDDGSLKSEKYYSVLGTTEMQEYRKDGEISMSGGDDMQGSLFPFFMVLSFSLGLIGAFKKEFRMYGIVVFMTMFITGILWMIIRLVLR